MEQHILTVTQINEYIKGIFDGSHFLSDVYVKGEISNFTNHYKTGHMYFTLKDEGGVLRAVMFRFNASELAFLPENGMKVIAHGRISSYAKDGSYQIYVDSMEPDGIGALYIAFEQLKEKLSAEGLFDPKYKKPIPKYPSKIGIVTSATGAAVRDMINVSRRRFPMTELILFPCLVQGDNAPEQIAQGIKFFNARCPVDTIIIGRGGGSLEELWAFNNEALARVIFASKIPIISAVGHETDFSISDFVSDLRAPTPSAAAELALPDYVKEKEHLELISSVMRKDLLGRISTLRERIEQISRKRCLSSPSVFFDDKRIALDNLANRLLDKTDAVLSRKMSELQLRTASLEALNPLKVIARGYSAVYKSDGKLIKSVNDVAVDDEIEFKTVDGSVSATVTRITED
ncbi:MAG: exodeoxyribonuclease VII large subunit [Clostridia bacterium]|nr:exodeoxyribonuclease VII large subunit [Clostridia bacterium]